MTKYLILPVLLGICSAANADIPCSRSPVDVEPLVHRVQVDYFEDGDTFAVEVKAPAVLRGLTFRGMGLVKGEDANVFALSLESTRKDDFYVAAFFLNQETMQGTTLSVAYGKFKNSCSSVIEVALDPQL